MGTDIINGTVHTGLSEILSDSYAMWKKIFAKDFTKEWVGYAISLASIAIAKESLFNISVSLRAVWKEPKAKFGICSSSCEWILRDKLHNIDKNVKNQKF